MTRKRRNQNRSEGRNGDPWEIFYNDFIGLVANCGDLHKLAKDAGVALVTVENIAYGWTDYPRMTTMYAIMTAMGRVEDLEAVFKTDKPLTKKQAIARRPDRLKKRYAKMRARSEEARVAREEAKAEKEKSQKPKRRRK